MNSFEYWLKLTENNSNSPYKSYKDSDNDTVYEIPVNGTKPEYFIENLEDNNPEAKAFIISCDPSNWIKSTDGYMYLVKDLQDRINGVTETNEAFPEGNFVRFDPNDSEIEKEDIEFANRAAYLLKEFNIENLYWLYCTDQDDDELQNILNNILGEVRYKSFSQIPFDQIITIGNAKFIVYNHNHFYYIFSDTDLSLPVNEMTDKGKDYLSNKIKKLKDEGYPQKQAVAIAYSYAKKKGYKTDEANESVLYDSETKESWTKHQFEKKFGKIGETFKSKEVRFAYLLFFEKNGKFYVYNTYGSPGYINTITKPEAIPADVKAKLNITESTNETVLHDKSDEIRNLREELQELKSERTQLNIDMENDTDINNPDEITANKYGDELNELDIKIGNIQSKISTLKHEQDAYTHSYNKEDYNDLLDLLSIIKTKYNGKYHVEECGYTTDAGKFLIAVDEEDLNFIIDKSGSIYWIDFGKVYMGNLMGTFISYKKSRSIINKTPESNFFYKFDLLLATPSDKLQDFVKAHTESVTNELLSKEKLEEHVLAFLVKYGKNYYNNDSSILEFLQNNDEDHSSEEFQKLLKDALQKAMQAYECIDTKMITSLKEWKLLKENQTSLDLPIFIDDKESIKNMASSLRKKGYEEKDIIDELSKQFKLTKSQIESAIRWKNNGSM